MTRIGPYEIVSLIGAGGMGEVYRATDTRLGREVAIKALPAEFASEPDRLRRFEQEAHAVAALNHPNILAIFDVGMHEGAPYFVTELLEGETLRARLQFGALRPEKAMEVAVQIGQGLAAAHEKGIVHRDVKPGNVFITKDDHVKILDFGLAKAVPPSTREERAKATTLETATDAGRVMGTAPYMSPEQVKGLPVDHRSDLFSLGVVLYEMVTGTQAFARDSTTETMAAILKEDPPEPSSVNSVVSPALSRAIAHCLEKRPEERFQTARDLTFELKAILADTTGGKTAPVPAFGRRRVAVAAALAAVTAVVVGGIWLLRQPKGALEATNFQLLSTFPGSHGWPTFSPDGSMIAFVSDADGSPQIWVKNLAGGEPIRITSGKLKPSHPSWSPRNDQIIFQAGEDYWSQQGLFSVPPLGGVARRIVENGRAPSFSPDGTRIAYYRVGGGVFVCAMDGTAEQRVSGLPAALSQRFEAGPAFSPDGKRLAIFLTSPMGFCADLWAVPTDSGEAQRLTFGHCDGENPAWDADGRSIIFSSSRSGSRTLWRVAAGGGQPGPVTTSAGDDNEPAVSRDGGKLVYTSGRDIYALMALDVKTGESRQVLEQRSELGLAKFSPSGSKLAFTSSIRGKGRLFVVGADGSGLRPIVPEAEEIDILPQWASDGQSLYFMRGGARPSFRKAFLAGGPSVELARGWGAEMGPLWQVSPDGRRVAYTEMRAHKYLAFVRDLASGARTQLGAPLLRLSWSHDGRFLVGKTEGRYDLAICPSAGGPCSNVGTSIEGVLPFWSPDDTKIYFIAFGNPAAPWQLWTMGRDGTDPRRIGELPGIHVLSFTPGISRQGSLAWVQTRPGRHELWMADLKR